MSSSGNPGNCLELNWIDELALRRAVPGGASVTGGFLGILLGAAFLIAACLHWNCCDQIQGGFQVEEVPAVEIVSEMRQAAEAMCSF